MHISEGVLSFSTVAAGWAGTTAIVVPSLRAVKGEHLPKMAVLTAVFFVASLIHIPFGPTSVHLILNGLVGVVTGFGAYPAILLGLALQAVLFQHGGLMVLGINGVLLGVPALAAYGIFRLGDRVGHRNKTAVFGFLAGASATALTGLILALLLMTTGQAFLPVAKLALFAHLPLMVVEGLVTAAAVSFLARVKPEMLLGPGA
ncbi:MAG: cobalt transporter CbiM [bacterium]|nr:cobalt transporter CbiM [bacterium]